MCVLLLPLRSVPFNSHFFSSVFILKLIRKALKPILTTTSRGATVSIWCDQSLWKNLLTHIYTNTMHINGRCVIKRFGCRSLFRVEQPQHCSFICFTQEENQRISLLPLSTLPYRMRCTYFCVSVLLVNKCDNKSLFIVWMRVGVNVSISCWCCCYFESSVFNIVTTAATVFYALQ